MGLSVDVNRLRYFIKPTQSCTANRQRDLCLDQQKSTRNSDSPSARFIECSGRDATSLKHAVGGILGIRVFEFSFKPALSRT